jgi:hypothetical protein
VAVTWVIDAAAPPTDADKANLKTKIAGQLGVDEDTGMKNFAVASQAARRLATSTNKHVRDRRLTPAVWTVGFDIVSTADAAAGAAASAVTSLGDAAFEAAVVSEIPSVESFTPPVKLAERTRKASSLRFFVICFDLRHDTFL